MIVQMKKLTLLCPTADQDRLLETLRELGAVHLSHFQPPEGDGVEQARTHLTYVSRALEVLPKHSTAKPSGRSADEVVKDVWDLIHVRKELEEKREVLRYERQRVEPYGSFDPASIRRLAEKGITVKLYQTGPKQIPEAPEGATLTILTQNKNGTFFAVMGRGEIEMNALEFRLPEQSLAEMDQQLAEIEKALSENTASLESYGGDYEVVARVVRDAEEKVLYLEARAGMGSISPVAFLRGFCPEESVEPIRAEAARNGWGIIIEDARSEDGVPTLIRNPKWVKPIKVIFDFIGVVPGYEEVDISAFFLLFFSVFFAIIVGDAGYGIIFLVLTFAMRGKLKKLSPHFFPLLLVLSICTIIWGTITGNYFGLSNLPAPLGGLKIPWLTVESNVMMLCFLIGAIHLTIAHGWNVIRYINSTRALAQVGWICTTWTMFFVARAMVLGYPFPGVLLWVFGVGVALIVLFMTPLRDLKGEWFNHAMLPLNLVSNFVDVVSYVRLFAVGTASFAMANAFNQMAADMMGGVVAGLIAALILFFGHVLNILLAVMGVLVHGIRLNTLEFSGHLGLQWSGVKYNPFAKKTGSR